MPNDSSTGGYLAPDALPAPVFGDALEDQLQEIIVGITGLAGNLIRPRWQPNTPAVPAATVDWAAMGLIDVVPEGDPYFHHVSAGDGQDEFTVHERITILASFYGPGADALAARLRDGLFVPQNREAMRANGMGLLRVGSSVTAPELVSQAWLNRVDLEFTVRRQVDRVYPVRNILSAQGTIWADLHEYDFDTANAAPLP